MKIQGQSGKMTFATTEPVGSAPDRVQIQMASLQELAADGTVLGGGGNAKHSFNSFATQDFTFGNPMASTIAGVQKDTAGADGLVPDSPTGHSPKDYNVTTVSFTSYLGSGNPDTDSKLEIESIIFMEDAILQFQNPDGTYIHPTISQGTVKFNVKMSQWNWCADNCKSADGVGDSVRLTIEMINEVTESSDTSSNDTTTEVVTLSPTTTPTTTTTTTLPDSNSSGTNSSSNSSRRLTGCTGGSCENGAVEDLGGVYLSVLNTYMIQSQDGTITQYTLPKNPVLTIDPPPGTSGASRRTTTLVLEFPRANFTANDTLIYDPLLSYSEFEDDTEDGSSTTGDSGTGGSSTTSDSGTGGSSTTSDSGNQPVSNAHGMPLWSLHMLASAALLGSAARF